jgi:low temperature requirement protein LtrA
MTFAIAYGCVRVAHIALFVLASRDEPELRHSVVGLGASTAIGVAILVAGALAPEGPRAAIWAGALVLDMAGPYFFGSEGWQLEPGHFAERHGLIVIIALGEAILAIGVAVDGTLSAPLIVGTVLGVGLAAALWWVYFDVASLVAARRLATLPPGRERNELARDSYSYLHLPMVAGIVATAFGVETVLAHDGEVMHTVPAVALSGGVALYLLAHVAFKRRAAGAWSTARLAAAAIVLALLPVVLAVEALVALAIVTAVVAGLIVFERIRFAELRAQERARLHEH